MKEKRTGTGQRMTWRSLTFQLLAVVVFPLIILLLVITFGSTRIHENAMRELVGDRDERAARMASTAIEEQVMRRVNEIRSLAAQVSNSPTGQAGEVLQNADYFSPDFDAGLAVLDTDGEFFAYQGNPGFWDEQAGRLDEGLRALAEDPDLSFYILQPGLQDTPMVVLAPTGDRQNVVAGAFYPGPLVESVFTDAIPQQGTSIAVISANREVLYQQGFDPQNEGIGQHAGVAEALAGQYGTTYVEVNGSEHVVAFSPVEPFGWALLIEEPWEHVASPILQTTLLAPLVMVPILLLALLALFFGIRQIVQPLQALADQSSRLGWGDYSAIEQPVGGVSEIRQLQTELIHMAHKLRAAQQSLHSYIGAITSGQEEERRRIARELHDDTIQSLIAFKQRIQLVEMDWEGHPVVQALGELEGAAEQTIENLRRMVAALRPIYLEDLGLVAAINMLVGETSKQLGSNVEFICQGQEQRLDAPVELALYRIVQEALSNITRHSEATAASVRMAFASDDIHIVIEDNGKGFQVPRSPSAFAPGGHFGLLGVFERADLIGGEVQVESSPGKGTRLVVSAPIRR